MDIQRIILLLGLAVTSYMMILAWNEDYGTGQQAAEAVATSEAPMPTTPSLADMPGIGDTSSNPIAVPSLEDDAEPSAAVMPTNASRFITIESDVLSLEVDLLGGDIVKGALPQYPATLGSELPFVLVDPRNDYAAQTGLIGKNGTDTAKGRPLFQADQTSYTLSGDVLQVDLEHIQDNGTKITKRFTLRPGDYLVDIEYLINNTSSDVWQGAMFGQIKRNSQPVVMGGEAGVGLAPFLGGAAYTADAPYTRLEFDDIEDEPYKEKHEGGYIALVQHYFVSAFVPGTEGVYNYQARKLGQQDTFLFGLTSPVAAVPAGESAQFKLQYYLGPKDQYRLGEISPGLDLTVDYGFLWWLAQPLFYLLDFIHGFVNNWGVAIIILTIIIKSALYPLSAASFRSMAKLRKLQPEMARLKERYGDDRQKFSQAMMDLYKKEGANPLGGCFPMLLQMPVFLALYWALMESVDLRQAPFFFWIKDLSAMDPIFVLPILMGVSMYITQLLQPEPPDPMQAKVLKLMPIMFTFFFLWFPSGLVLYWLMNNLLSIAQQWYINRQIEKDA